MFAVISSCHWNIFSLAGLNKIILLTEEQYFDQGYHFPNVTFQNEISKMVNYKMTTPIANVYFPNIYFLNVHFSNI